MLINGTYRVNLTRQTATTSSPSSSQYEENSTNMESFQLPDTLLETAGTYQCGLDISNLLTPILSKNSSFIPWPGQWQIPILEISEII